MLTAGAPNYLRSVEDLDGGAGELSVDEEHVPREAVGRVHVVSADGGADQRVVLGEPVRVRRDLQVSAFHDDVVGGGGGRIGHRAAAGDLEVVLADRRRADVVGAAGRPDGEEEQAEQSQRTR